MLVFISGSINAGKTTTAQALAKKLGWTNINVDDLTDNVENFDIYEHLDLAMDLAIEAINNALELNKNVVANFVVRQKDYQRLEHEVNTKPQIFITLHPGLEIAQSKRGERILTDWEIKRIKSHYEEGIAFPFYGYIVNNANLSVDETVTKILKIVAKYIN